MWRPVGHPDCLFDLPPTRPRGYLNQLGPSRPNYRGMKFAQVKQELLRCLERQDHSSLSWLIPALLERESISISIDYGKSWKRWVRLSKVSETPKFALVVKNQTVYMLRFLNENSRRYTADQAIQCERDLGWLGHRQEMVDWKIKQTKFGHASARQRGTARVEMLTYDPQTDPSILDFLKANKLENYFR